MKNQKMRQLSYYSLLLILVVTMLTQPVLATTEEPAAAGDVSGVITGIWLNVSGQMKTICNNVVFPALAVVCGVGFVIALIIAIYNYRKHQTVEVGWPIALLLGLIISATASTWVWQLIGA